MLAHLASSNINERHDKTADIYMCVYCVSPGIVPGWKVCQLRTEYQETDKILRTKNEINVHTKIKIEIARDGPIPIFYDNVL